MGTFARNGLIIISSLLSVLLDFHESKKMQVFFSTKFILAPLPDNY